jgi:hypothetical protein
LPTYLHTLQPTYLTLLNRSYTLSFGELEPGVAPGGAGDAPPPSTFLPEVIPGAPATMANGALTVRFDTASGLMAGIDTANGSTVVEARQTFHEYIDGEGGAYCLVMTGPARRVAAPYNVSHLQGPVFSQVPQHCWNSDLPT